MNSLKKKQLVLWMNLHLEKNPIMVAIGGTPGILYVLIMVN